MGGLRQFRTQAEAARIGSVKTKRAKNGKGSNRNPVLAARVERALIRAGASARRTARMHGTPVYILSNGRIVAEQP